ncbi:MAG: hypothetical protein Q7S21_02345 [archaeon]|nr:hypothetical protein [archaeon]
MNRALCVIVFSIVFIQFALTTSASSNNKISFYGCNDNPFICEVSAYQTYADGTYYIEGKCNTTTGQCEQTRTQVNCNPTTGFPNNGCPSDKPICLSDTFICVAPLETKTYCGSDCCSADSKSFLEKQCSSDKVCVLNPDQETGRCIDKQLALEQGLIQGANKNQPADQTPIILGLISVVIILAVAVAFLVMKKKK